MTEEQELRLKALELAVKNFPQEAKHDQLYYINILKEADVFRSYLEYGNM